MGSANTIAALLVTLGLDSKDFSKGLDGAEKQASSLGGKIAGFLGKAALGTAVAGVAAVGGAFIAAVGNAQEAQNVMAQTEAVIKSTGKAAGLTAQDMGTLASSLSSANGLSKFGDEAVLSGENLLATFTEIKGPVFKGATQAIVDMGEALHNGPEANAIAVGKALNDPIAGFTKLQKIGVTFTKSQIDAGTAMAKNGDIAGAQQIILDELAKEFGGSAAAAANTFSGKLATLKDKFGELLETAGTKFLPVLTMVLDTLNSPLVQTAISGLIDGLFNGISTAIAVATPIMGNLISTINDVVAAFGAGGLGAAINTVLNEFLGLNTFIGFDIEDAFNKLITIGSTVVAWFQATLPQAIQVASSYIQPFIDILLSIPDRIQPFIDTLIGRFNILKDFFVTTLGFISNTFNSKGSEVLSSTTETFNSVISTVTKVLTGINTIVNAVLSEVLKFWKANGQDITNFVVDMWLKIQVIIQLAMQVINKIIVPALMGIAAFILAHSSTIQAIFNDVWAIIKTIITTAVDLITTVLKVALALWNGDWAGAWNEIKEFSARFVVSLISVFQSLIDGLYHVVTLALEGVRSLFNGLIGDASSIGTDIVNGIINGIQAAAKGLYDTLENLASSALKAAKDAVGIGSPSKLFDTDFGVPIVQGAIHGVESMLPAFNNTLANMVTMPNAAVGINGGNLPIGSGSKNTTINATIDARGADKGAGDRIKDAFDQIGKHLGNDVDLRIRLGAT